MSGGPFGGRALILSLPCILFLVAFGGPPVRAAEYRDPQGRFALALPDGFREVGRPVLEARLAALRRTGLSVPAYAAAFDLGTEPRLGYPYALLEVVSVAGADWTGADLQDALGKLDMGPAAQKTAAAFDRLGLAAVMRDPHITFVRWEPERQAAAYRITTLAQGGEILGTGRLYFYRSGYVTLWCYYRAGTPYAEAAERMAEALTVLPAYRVLPGGRMAGGRPLTIVAAAVVAAALAGLGVWVARHRRRPAGLMALALGLALAGCASAPGAARAVAPGGLSCAPSGYGTLPC